VASVEVTRELDVSSSREAADALEISVHDTPASLAALEACWRALAAVPGVSPFLGFDWSAACAELFSGPKRRLHVVAVRRGAELLGIAPWLICEPERRLRSRRLVWLGAEHTGCDYLDALCVRGAERAVAGALYTHLFSAQAPRWHRLELRGMPAGSAFLFHFRACFERAGKYTLSTAGPFCPTRSLAPGGVLATLPAPRQKRLRYERSVLERAGEVGHETRLAGEPGFEDAFAEFTSLYRQRWTGDTDALRCVDAFARRADAAGALRLDLLRVDGVALAGLLHLRRGDTLYLYLMAVEREAFPKLSLGSLLIGLVLEHASAEGVAHYDFLRGGEDYKLQWADAAERCLDFRAFRRSPALLARLALAHLSDLLKVAWR
jgi:CelD/BcsL family acetyltransferase involved in cellulose biosynthesis